MAKKSPISRKALKIGSNIAAEVLARRRDARETRAAALARAKKRVTRTVASTGAKALIAKATITHQSAGMLIAEGDSWFDYPLHDVLSDLEDFHGFAHVHCLDLRKTLSTGANFKDDWANELHPTGDGF